MGVGRLFGGRTAVVVAGALTLGVAGVALAQLDASAPRGVAPIDDAGSFEVDGIDVDVGGATADAARLAGWREAQRRGWRLLAQRLGAPGVGASDAVLDSLTGGIVVEREQLSPRRYVARLGVLFDRSRAAAVLGVGGQVTRSPPMLVIPLQVSGGVATVFEQRTPWQEAWARFRTGNSTVDYVRPSGTGPDALLMNAGQVGRRDRRWWRTVLDQYGASDVIVPTVELYRQWPGGPVIGIFTARFGPDDRALTRFALRVGSAASLPALLDAGVRRLDARYADALRSGELRVDPGLIPPPPPPVEDALLEDTVADEALATVSRVGGAVTVQFDTPDAAAVSSAEAAIRALPGVRAAATTSLALGGVSVMRVLVDGDAATLRSALTARGWQVEEAGGTLRIRRAGG